MHTHIEGIVERNNNIVALHYRKILVLKLLLFKKPNSYNFQG